MDKNKLELTVHPVRLAQPLQRKAHWVYALHFSTRPFYEMDAPERRTPVSFRLIALHKRCRELAAQHEQRSLTNFVENLITDYCESHGIETESPVGSSPKTKKQGKS